MKLLKAVYEKRHHESAPYYFDYSLRTVLTKPLRKWLVNTVAAGCPFNCVRIGIYRLCGFSIGKNVFIGMHCYLDDMCYDLMQIGNHVVISYGVYFACHGKNQGHYKIVIEDHAYIGMRASVISKNRSEGTDGVTIGSGAVVGACALVNTDVPPNTTAIGVPCRIIEESNE